MPIDTGYLPPLPAEQQRLREKCYHTTGTFIPFPQEALERLPGVLRTIMMRCVGYQGNPDGSGGVWIASRPRG
jgi:hypothetical protein